MLRFTTAENIRRMFHRWLSATRVARRRRVTLQRKEGEIKRATLAVAWDEWRDRFNDEKLRPLVCLFPRVFIHHVSTTMNRNTLSYFKITKVPHFVLLAYGDQRRRYESTWL
jgi:hypothetical protein